ncbi:MAG TPA: MFS transporter [Micropepsaceae bacterium]|nr:MFS transporter [Micropepsaceae bacterium]
MSGQEAIFAKCARRLIPLMVVLYVVNFIDRVNVGFAALTMNKDLVFAPSVYGMGAGALFVGFSVFSVPSTVLLEKFGARRWAFGTLTIWGALSASTALVKTPFEFYAVRFFLGVAEAGFIPGMIVYLTYWFPKAYRARFGAAFLIAQPLAFIVGSPLSGLILLNMDGVLSLKGWQWLFVLEGLPSALLAFAALLVLSNRPNDASWLSADEKRAIEAELAQEDQAEHGDLWRALFDARVIAIGAVNFGILFGLYGTTLWLPQIVQAMGFSTLSTTFIVALPFIAAVPAMILWGLSSDRKQERIWHVALPLLIAAGAFLVASASASNTLSLIALAAAVIAIYPVLAPVISIPATFLKGEANAAGTSLCYAIGSPGGFLGPTIIGLFKQSTGDYSAAMVALSCALAVAAAIILGVGRAMAARRVQYS